MTHDEKIVESHRLLMSDIVELKALADEAAEKLKLKKDARSSTT